MKEDYILEIKNVSKKYSSQTVLDNISFKMKKGEVLGILGQNASGKSTLAHILSGITLPDTGEFYINGQKTVLSAPLDAKRAGIQLVPQNIRLLERFSIAENIFFPAYFSSQKHHSPAVNWKTMYSQADQLCSKYGFSIDVRKRASSLSIGEKQIVSILKAVNQSPDILIMDEATSALPEIETQKVLELVNTLKKFGISIIYCSYSIDDILKISDHVLALSDGKIVADTTSVDKLPDEFFKTMSGPNTRERYPKLPVKKGAEILRVQNLSFNNIIRDISFSLRRGEVLGLTGLLGSGRSTTVKTIVGINKPTSGQIFINGEPVKIRSPKDALKAGLFYIPESRLDQGLIYNCSIRQNISLSNLKSITLPISKYLIDLSTEKEVAVNYIRAFSIQCQDDKQKVKALSGGNQQKVLISKGLFSNAQVFLMDEPTKNIDYAEKVHVYNIINELTRQGKSVILLSSDTSELLGMCDRILVINHGKIARELNYSEATKEKVLLYSLSDSSV